MKEYKKAIADCDEAIRLDQKRADAYAQRAFAFWCMGRNEKALGDCTKALERLPNTLALLVRAEILYDTGRPNEALANLDKAIAIDPRYLDALLFRGWVHKELGKLEQALSEYTEAIRIVPNSSNAHYGRAVVFFQMKNFKNSLADCDEAIRLDVNNADAHCGTCRRVSCVREVR